MSKQSDRRKRIRQREAAKRAERKKAIPDASTTPTPPSSIAATPNTESATPAVVPPADDLPQSIIDSLACVGTRRGTLGMLVRFEIKQQMRPRVAEEAFKILSDPESSRRDKIAAGKLLAKLDELNVEQERLVLGQPLAAFVMQQTTINNPPAAKPEGEERGEGEKSRQPTLAEEVAAMDGSILPPHLMYPKLVNPASSNGNGNGNGNGHHSNGNGNGHGTGG